MNKKNTRKNGQGFLIVGVVAAMVLIGSIVAIVMIKYHAYRANQTYEELQSQMTTEVIPEVTLSNTEPVKEEPPVQTEADIAKEQTDTDLWDAAFIRTPDKEVDFTKLQNVNQDVYAWITIPGTEIDYPIAHCDKDDAIYLEQDINHQKSAYGMIFTDTSNTNDLSDRMTLIYGHNMKDGSMFAGLHAFRDSKFFNEHDTIKIYMPEGELNYKIFACYTAKNEHILEKNNFADDVAYLCYIEDVKSMRDMSANIRDMEIDTDDRMITLVTCIGDQSKRLFVQAVLQEPGSDE